MRLCFIMCCLFLGIGQIEAQKVHFGANVGVGYSFFNNTKGHFIPRKVINLRKRIGISLAYENKQKLIISVIPSVSKLKFNNYNSHPSPANYEGRFVFFQNNIHLPILVGKSFYINEDSKVMIRGGIDFVYHGVLEMEYRISCGWFSSCVHERTNFNDRQRKTGFMIDALLLTADKNINITAGINYFQSFDAFNFIYDSKKTELNIQNLSLYFYIGI